MPVTAPAARKRRSSRVGWNSSELHFSFWDRVGISEDFRLGISRSFNRITHRFSYALPAE